MEEREVRWTAIALKQKLDIYEFWFERNQSLAYSEKLESIFDKTISLIKKHPFLGIKFDNRPIYFINTLSYRIYYIFNDSTIYILQIWDTRRNPLGFEV